MLPQLLYLSLSVTYLYSIFLEKLNDDSDDVIVLYIYPRSGALMTTSLVSNSFFKMALHLLKTKYQQLIQILVLKEPVSALLSITKFTTMGCVVLFWVQLTIKPPPPPRRHPLYLMADRQLRCFCPCLIVVPHTIQWCLLIFNTDVNSTFYPVLSPTTDITTVYYLKQLNVSPNTVCL